MKNIILILLLIILPISLYSFDGDAAFNKATGLYNAGQYDHAKDIYIGLLDSGYTNATIYYNLANTYYRLDKIPQAILNYERAKLLDPFNEDINFNLKLANLKIVDKFEPLPKLFFVEWYEDLLDLANSDTWAYMSIGLIWITLLFVFLTFWFSFQFNVKKSLFMTAVITFVIGVFTMFMTFRVSIKENLKNYGIIYVPSVYVKSSPDNNATDLFILHEGTKVQILENINNWYEVKIQNGNVGWIQMNSFEVI
ncbi:MAG TPA: SH3 domain-containing protein [Candidatus Kapabacteria bacterium]|nr:SH3 domain-containing protein [Candidatus Kapabacteria bacterium]